MTWGFVAVGVGTAVAGGFAYLSADEAASAQEDAANKNIDTQRYIYNENKKLFEPFYKTGTGALPGLASWDANNPLPSYQQTVVDPMNSWNYTQTPAYKAKYALGSENLNNQLQARGLGSSGIGANRAADLSRRLTAEDYATERNYRTSQLNDLYKSKYSENTDRYNRLLDQVKIGQGAAGTLGQAGNAYAQGVGQATTQAGQAEAGFYAGLPGAALNTVSTGLKAYDTGQRAGWWGNNDVTNAGTNAANVAYNPSMQPDQYNNGLYGL